MPQQNEQPTQMAIYLGGPIDEVTSEEAAGWRNEVATMLPAGVIAVDPVHGIYGDDPRTAHVVDRTNRWFIHACDGVLCNLENRAAAFGTIREIEFARRKNLPVVVVSPDIILSLSAYDVYQEDTLKRGLARLVEAITDRIEAPPSHPVLMLGIDMQPPQSEDDD